MDEVFFLASFGVRMAGGESVAPGSSGRVMEGAGFGDGMLRRESRGQRRRGGAVRGGGGEARSRERKESEARLVECSSRDMSPEVKKGE